MLYYLPHIKLQMDIDDVPDSGQPRKNLLAKQKPKVLPDELGLCSKPCKVCHHDGTRSPQKQYNLWQRLPGCCKIPDNTVEHALLIDC
jgi:hypothetical protein